MSILTRMRVGVRRCAAIESHVCVLRKAGSFKTTLPQPELDIEYLCNLNNKCEIEANIRRRKGVGDIDNVHQLYSKLQKEKNSGNQDRISECMKRLYSEALLIPNKSSDIVRQYGDEPRVVKEVGVASKFNFKPKEFSEITKDLSLLRTENLGNLSGHRSYFLMGDLAELENALVKFTVKELLKRNFQLISVPDILPSNIIESCGMSTQGERTQVYKLDPELYGSDLCLSGTSEMAIAGYLGNQVYPSEKLPLKLAAVSRCYRAETSSLAEERGIFRVHQFNKVEMFGVTDRETSAGLLEEFCEIQELNFESLGLHFKKLDMPPHELGAPAFRKYDIEAWLPGRNMFGEISSSSDCTDYQSRRLGIKYRPRGSETPLHAHTVNGTACAIPRMLIAILETHQQADGSVGVPKALHPFMRGKTKIVKQKLPEMKGLKIKRKSAKKTTE